MMISAPTPFSFWARSVKCGKLEPDDLGLALPNLTTFPPFGGGKVAMCAPSSRQDGVRERDRRGGSQKENPRRLPRVFFLCLEVKMQLNKSRRRRVWNPQLVAVWNQTVGLYVINPKENAPAVMPYAFGDYILTCGEITCQSFGLDRKKQVFRLAFFLAPPVGLEPTTS